MTAAAGTHLSPFTLVRALTQNPSKLSDSLRFTLKPHLMKESKNARTKHQV